MVHGRRTHETSSHRHGLTYLATSGMMSMNASILVDSVGPPSAEVCIIAASFP
jgi:hypothetical protein